MHAKKLNLMTAARAPIVAQSAPSATKDCGSCHLDVSSAAGSTGQCIVNVPAEFTINNNAQQIHKRRSGSAARQKASIVGPTQRRQPQPSNTTIMATFTDYVKLQDRLQRGSNNAHGPNRRVVLNIPLDRLRAFKEATSRNAAESVELKPGQSIFQRPQLSTFAEYRERSLTNAENRGRRSSSGQSVGANQSVAEGNDGLTVDLSAQEENDDEDSAAATAASADEDDADTGEKRRSGCCGCCSRSRRGRPDSSTRRKRRLVGPKGATTGARNRALSVSLELDTDLVDVKDMDPTITLMPYVLFDSERSKVLYQAVNSEEAELLKKAIALHANDLYKRVLMRLYMYRYLKLFREAVVQEVLSKKILLSPDDALAANVLGIDISEDSKSGISSSAALSIGMTFDSQPIETISAKPSAHFIDPSGVTRQMFKPAPKLTDVDILDLLNSGKVIDVTNRASLESLVSVETTKLGQRKSI